eukprot:SAG11_NODE_12629_length_694_cov_0.776471_1_plen_105_part_00
MGHTPGLQEGLSLTAQERRKVLVAEDVVRLTQLAARAKAQRADKAGKLRLRLRMGVVPQQPKRQWRWCSVGQPLRAHPLCERRECVQQALVRCSVRCTGRGRLR